METHDPKKCKGWFWFKNKWRKDWNHEHNWCPSCGKPYAVEEKADGAISSSEEGS